MTTPTGKDFESFDSFFAGLTMAEEKDSMALYEQYIKSHITSILFSLADDVEGKRKDGGICAKDLNGPLCGKCRSCRSYNAALNDSLKIIRSYIQKS